MSLIKNYTSGISAERSISEIEAKLASVGATGIMKLYGPDKRVSALIFKIPANGTEIPIRLPAKVGACHEALWKEYCRSHSRNPPEAKQRLKEQAEKTAWRLAKEWIDVQISYIVMEQVKPLEVFLAHVWDGKQTYFERMEQAHFNMLLPERCS